MFGSNLHKFDDISPKKTCPLLNKADAGSANTKDGPTGINRKMHICTRHQSKKLHWPPVSA
jgi:hypothetical protein